MVLIRIQAGYGGHLLHHGRRLPRHGGHQHDGKSSERICSPEFSRVSQAISILLYATEGVNTTPHRAHFTHANIFSRVAQGAEQSPARIICVRVRTTTHRSRASCLIRGRYGRTSHRFFSRSAFFLFCILLIVMNNHTIHG